MTFPQGQVSLVRITRYQGVIIAEVAVTFILYLVLKMLHFCKWGHLQVSSEETEEKKQAETDERKWSQSTWDIYFPIIFANHIIALSLTFIYQPSIFVSVVGFLHLAFFIAMIIVNVFIKDSEPGNGPRTTVSRIMWALMCLMNSILIIVGLAGVPSVFQNPA